MSAISLPVLPFPTSNQSPASGGGGSCGVVEASPLGNAALTASEKPTTVGNYFIANYPPFGFWKPENVSDLHAAMDRPPEPGVDLGLYAHIPFCRKRCHFCYFRVYTDKNAAQIRGYIDALLSELRSYAGRPFIGGRKPSFVYFGGGTPSYLSPDQLRTLFDGMKAILPWDDAQEIAFEGEPGTLNDIKLRTLREMGVTRLSLGIEHMDDHILEINGRAHRSKEVYRAYDFARQIGFPQINVDLIAGMVEETDERWAETIEKVIALGPDSVTIYQMEIPYNTTIYQQMKAEGKLVAPVADWETKRRWLNEAFARFQSVGYSVATANTVIKNPDTKFLYRTGLFNGTDLLSIGVSSFGYINGVNYQNQHDFQPYVDTVAAGRSPNYRAYALSREEQYIRELALQMKGASVSIEAFTRKFGRDPREQFAGAFDGLRRLGLLQIEGDRLGFTREGLLQADRLLFEFFRPEHRVGRFA
jgi:oxygen-independent coproporphyrinogen III oxidase